MTIQNDIWKNIKIIKSLGKGSNGETFLIELNNQQYALKRQKIIESDINNLNNEIKFYAWIDKLNNENKLFFMEHLYHRKYDKCEFNFVPIRGNIGDERIASSLCFDIIVKLKDGTLDKLINNLIKQQILSAFIQMLYAIYLMHKSYYYHFDAKTENIAYNKTNDEKIEIGKFGKIRTFGYIYSLIDYGSVVHKKFKLDEFSEKLLKTQKEINSDLSLLVDYILLNNDKIYSQIQENKIHLKPKEVYDLIINISKEKYNKIKKFIINKMKVTYLDELSKLQFDEIKKTPKYIALIYEILQIYQIKYPKTFIKHLKEYFNINLTSVQSFMSKKELLYIKKNHHKIQKIIKYFLNKYADL